MTFTEWAMDYPLHSAEEMEIAMTRMEKFANNYTTIVIARAAMTVTPLLLSFFIWLFWQVYSSLDARVTEAERALTAQASTLQDHESRMVFGRSSRESFEGRTKEQFGQVDETLKEVQRQLAALNGGMIRLQTTVENRLPPRATPAEPAQ